MIHPDAQLATLGHPFGFGIVATRALPRGTLLWVQDPLDRILSGELVDNLPDLFVDLTHRFAYRNADGNHVLTWDDARFVNHSCEPNCGITPFGFEIAMRDIAAGEQVTNDYAMFHTRGFERFYCCCGTTACRGQLAESDGERLRPAWDRAIAESLPLVRQVPQALASLLDLNALERAAVHYQARLAPAPA